ncbi:NUDIX hydrolase [Candidatus Woesearchaeota archaeon]|nr:NUDIX hydrolase [Candidatus Woesearchaeota archaeon]
MPKQEEVQTYRNPIPTTDIIIEYQKGVVLIERKNPPYGLAIPGGFAEWGISLEDNARKEAKEETNLEVILENPDTPFVFSDPDRDSRDHMISVTYIAKGYGELKAGDDAKDAKVYTINEIIRLVENNQLAFDHADILRKYLKFRGYEK